jgi:hypothetical protein
MTDNAAIAPAAPATAPAPSRQPAGMPVTPAAFDAPEAVAARGRIEELKGDKAFYARLQQKDEAAHREWCELHR